jgi:hypothetical protein
MVNVERYLKLGVRKVMKLTSFIALVVVLIHLQVAGQVDSIRVDSIRINHKIPDFFIPDCNHGHVCCGVGCSCCPQMHREQEYSMLFKKKSEGTTVLVQGEKFAIAKNHGDAPIVISFFKDGIQQAQYQSIKQPQIQDYSDWNYDHLTFFDSQEVVIDSTGAYRLIDVTGAIHPFEIQHVSSIWKKAEIATIFEYPTAGANTINMGRIHALQNSRGELITPFKYTDIQAGKEEQFIVIAVSTKGHPNIYNLDQLGTVGVIDVEGNQIIPCEYNDVEYIGENRYKVRKEGLWYLFTSSGEQITKGYRYLGNCNEDRIAFKKEEKLGYLNRYGKIVIRPKLDFGKSFYEGRAAVLKDGKWGYMDASGNVIVDFKYDIAHDFHEGVALVSMKVLNKGANWGLLDLDGNPIKTKVEIDNAEAFRGDYFLFWNRGSGEGLMDKKGKIILEPHYDIESYGTSGNWLVNDRLVVRDLLEERKVMWVSVKGEVIHEFKGVDNVQPLLYYTTQGARKTLPYYIVQKNGKRGLCDLDAKIIVPFDNYAIHGWTESHVIITDDKNSKVWIYDLEVAKKVKLPEGRLTAVYPDGTLLMHSGPSLYDRRSEIYYFNTDGTLMTSGLQKADK